VKAKRDIKSISYVKTHTAEVVSLVNKTKNPLYITQNGEAKAVIMDTDSFEKMREASTLLKLISFGENDVKSGDLKTQTDFFNQIEEKLINEK
jgi:prevent-host-death family protein